MKNKLIVAFASLILSILLFISFRTYLPLSPQKYLAKVYGDPHSNSQEKTFGELIYRLKIIPSEALALRSIQPKFSKEAYKEAFIGYENTINFVFSIQGKKGNDLMQGLAGSTRDYEDLVRYFAFDCKNDFFLFNQHDTLLCSFTHFERTFNLDSKITISGTFVIPADSKISEKPQSFTIGYNGEILNLAFINFYFNHSDLLPKPNLIF